MIAVFGFLKKSLPVVAIILVSYWAIESLFHPGFFSMHDDQQVARLFEMDKALRAGQFPVRWVADLGFGFGYALFNFYPPLVYYLGEIYHLLGLGVIDATKLVWLTALIGSGLAMYILTRELFGKIGGVVSGLFYIYAPYHAVDAYVRGALAELFSFIWLPLVLWATFRKKPVLTGIFLAFLMVTHNLIFLPFMGIFVIWSLVFDRKSLILSPIIAMALTAFFWMPELGEKQFTLVDQILIKNLAFYRIHFVCWPQLWSSPWGYGGSVAGCADGLSFILGRIHLVAAVLGLGIGIYFRNNKHGRVLLLTAGLLAFSVFMTTTSSIFVWDRLSPLWYLQFPWRFLEFAVLFSALLAGSIGLIPAVKVRLVLALGLIVGLLVINTKYFQPQKFLTDATDRILITNNYLRWYVSSSSFEFMPRGIATYITNQGVIWPRVEESGIRNQEFKAIQGDLKIDNPTFQSGRFRFSGQSIAGAVVEVQQTNFPGWRIWIDGKEAVINDNNYLRLISFIFPTGVHQVDGRFTNTPIRTLGNLVSLGSIILVGSYLIYGTRRSKT